MSSDETLLQDFLVILKRTPPNYRNETEDMFHRYYMDSDVVAGSNLQAHTGV